MGEAAADRHGRVFASTGEDRTVFPPPFAEELRVLLEVLASLGGLVIIGVLNIIASAMQVLSGAIDDSFAGIGHGKRIFHDVNSVALSTGFAGTSVVELGWVDDKLAVLAAAVIPITIHRVLIVVDVGLAGAMTRFTGDP